MTPDRYDILIAGAGLIGLCCACLFARQGLRVAVVEARAAGAPEDARVTAVSPAAARLLDTLGVWPQAPHAVGAYRAMRVWDHHSAARIAFSAADIAHPNLGYIVENRTLIEAMRGALDTAPRVTILEGTRVEALAAVDSHVHDRAHDMAHDMTLAVTLSTAVVETSLLVAADGAASPLRAMCGISTERADFAQDAIVTTVATAHPHAATAWQCFLETGPAAMLPRGDGHCALVWSCTHPFAETLMALDDDAFCARLQPLFFAPLGALRLLAPRRRFPLRQHHAQRYIAPAVALVGDAAHGVHPLAGLGANLGFMDVAVLAEEVAAAVARGHAPGRMSVLRRYQRRRRGDNGLALRALAGLHHLFGDRRAALRFTRALGMRAVGGVAPLRRTLAAHAAGLRGDLPALCRSGAPAPHE